MERKTRRGVALDVPNPNLAHGAGKNNRADQLLPVGAQDRLGADAFQIKMPPFRMAVARVIKPDTAVSTGSHDLPSVPGIKQAGDIGSGRASAVQVERF